MIKTFEELRDYLAAIPNIANGGCGISALALKTWCDRHNMSNVELVLGYDEDRRDAYNTNAAFFNSIHNDSRAPLHAFINFNGELMDDGHIDFEWGEEEPGVLIEESTLVQTVTPTQLRLLLSNGHWNCSFNRKKWLPKIEKKLGYSLELK